MSKTKNDTIDVIVTNLFAAQALMTNALGHLKGARSDAIRFPKEYERVAKLEIALNMLVIECDGRMHEVFMDHEEMVL